MKHILKIPVPDDAFVRDGIRLLTAIRESLPPGWNVKVTLQLDDRPRR
jgi:hypothetical protein